MINSKVSTTEPVAIIGIGCRFPGANSPQAFWRLLVDGVDAIGEVPANRFDIESYYDVNPGVAGKIFSRFGGFLSDVERFDAEFFGISPREAEVMDPQQRILLEVAYEALQDGGLSMDAKSIRTGVFLGIMSDDYLRQTYRTADLDLTIAAGGSRGAAAARISYTLGFDGPSMVVDTDRASSLTAIHLASQSLRVGECSLALAGASNLILGPELSVACSRSGILSADGRCKFCDASADGIGRSEGCGVLVLKLLSHATAAGDRIYAVIRGSAVANNGHFSNDLMTPSAPAQEALIRTALEDANVSADDLLYVEAHGTGTRLGDLAETEALGSVFGRGRRTEKPCLIGSVKTNIGHAEAAGGMAGVIKVALALQHGLIPKSLHFEHENPKLALAMHGLRVQTEITQWPGNAGKPALAGVSAFGLTGSLAHVVLEAAPAKIDSSASTGPRSHLFPVSARSAASLLSLIAAYSDWFEGTALPESFSRACFSASVHRQHHRYRASFIASSGRELGEKLKAYLGTCPQADAVSVVERSPKLAFVFLDTTELPLDVGRELLEKEPAFREGVERCDVAIRAQMGWSVVELLSGNPRSINSLGIASFAVMVGMVTLWRSWGVEPNVVIGFGVGEVAAAYVAGMLDLEDAVAVARCSSLLARSADGSTLETGALLETLRGDLGGLKPRQGSIPLVSSVEHNLMAGTELSAEYWLRSQRSHLPEKDGLAWLLQNGYGTFVTIGSSQTDPLHSIVNDSSLDSAIAVSFLENQEARKTLYESLGLLYGRGLNPHWTELFDEHEKQFLPLPTYCWDGKEYLLRPDRVTPQQIAVNRPVSSLADGIPPALSRLHSLPSGQKAAFLKEHLRQITSRILGLPNGDALDRTLPLREAGLTSLMAIELANRIEETLAYACPASATFNYPTIDQLADYLRIELAGDLPAREATTADEKTVAQAAGSTESRDVTKEDLCESMEPIAIIGLGCRFPGGAEDPDSYWDILRRGVDTITEVPLDRWDIRDFYDPDPEAPGKMYSRWGGFLNSVDHFDAAYFGISPREAVTLDPQQRILLQVTVEALEHAGHAPDPQSPSETGVFVGVMNSNDFASVKKVTSDFSRIGSHDSTGNATSAAAGRLSYALGFHGPSMAVDTACSSSLVAIHLACQALRARECRMAVAGGVNVIVAPETTISFCKTRMLSPTGRCKTFDAKADGYVRGEGCGMVVLKRLSDAARDNDNILAVIRGSAVNQDGRSSSLTAPNGLAQEALLRQVLRKSGVRAEEIDYVEAHGTGTALGDPIELEALGRVLGEERDASMPLLVGSVKTNIGHLESAAGVAGLIKVVLSLHHGAIPGNLHFEQINPRISLADCRASIPTRLTLWNRNGRRRLAGVSSFGFVGTNAHVILEEAPQARTEQTQKPQPTYRLLALSARSQTSLRELVDHYDCMLSTHAVDIDDLCYSANLGRVHHDVRAAITASSTDSMQEKLVALSVGLQAQTGKREGVGKIAFLFTGQGAQYQLMGQKLYKTEGVFRAALDRCANVIDPLLQTSLIRLIHGGDQTTLQETQFAQPAIFALQYALLEQWRAWGVEPDMVMGHSLGEYMAAVAAKVLSLEQAAYQVVARATLIQSIPKTGGSAAVFASEERVRSYVEPFASTVSIAAENAPERVLIAGEGSHLQIVCDRLRAKGVEVRSMLGQVAPHCPLMDSILDRFEIIAATATYGAPTIPMVSTGTAQVMTAEGLSRPQHWRNLIRDKVRFREGMQVLHDAGCRTFLEIGPRHTLIRLGQMCQPLPGLTWLASLSKEKHDQEQMLESLGQLYASGVDVHWTQRHLPFTGKKIILPTTIFETKSFWPQRNVETMANHGRKKDLAMPTMVDSDRFLGHRVRSPCEDIQFEAELDLHSLPMLADHRVWGKVLVPGAAQLVRVLEAMGKVSISRQFELREAVFPEPMILSDEGSASVSCLVLTPKQTGYDFKIQGIASRSDEDTRWQLHLSGHVRVLEDSTRTSADSFAATESYSQGPYDPSCVDVSAEEISGDEFYAGQGRSGYLLGPSFRWLEQVWLWEDEAQAELRMPIGVGKGDWKGLHPGLIDSCFQVACRVAHGELNADSEAILVPAAIFGLRAFATHVDYDPADKFHCQVRRINLNAHDIALKISLFDKVGQVVLNVAQLHLKPYRVDFGKAKPADFNDVFHRIVWSESALAPSTHGRWGRWLILADEGGVGQTLAELMRSHGHESHLAYKGPVQVSDQHHLHIDSTNLPEIRSLLADMHARDSWRGIVFLWGLDCDEQPIHKAPDDQSSACHAFIGLAKAMIEDANCAPVWVVSRGAQRTLSENKLGDLDQAALLGLARVFANEHPTLVAGLVDLDPHSLPEDSVPQLLEELWSDDKDKSVAYRSERRLIPRLKPYERIKKRDFRARKNASYLITGAFGALGRHTADWLTASGAKHLALLSRRLPDQAVLDWIENLRTQGVRVLVLTADVSVLQEMTEAFAELDQTMPTLRGVIHAAGLLEDGVLSQVDSSSFARVQAPKTHGSWNLHLLSANRQLDFWVIFSSTMSVLGNPAQSAYAAANSYADGLANLRRMQGEPAVSINWGPWQGDGMSSRMIDNLGHRWGLRGIDPADGVQMLGQVLDAEVGQIWVAAIDANRLRLRLVDSPHLELLSSLVGSGDAASAVAAVNIHVNTMTTLREIPEDQLRTAITGHLVELVRSVTGMEAFERVEHDARFENLGVDSLLSLDLLNALTRVLEINLPATLFINHPTIELLVTYLYDEVCSKLTGVDRIHVGQPAMLEEASLTASELIR